MKFNLKFATTENTCILVSYTSICALLISIQRFAIFHFGHFVYFTYISIILGAATALNNIERKLGVIHTINASRILRSRIPLFPKLNDVALYKQVLATNAILTKLDGAKALAVYRAEKRFHNEEEMGSSIEEEVDSLRDELASAEKDLSEETDKELEDEREAQEKIQEAMERNKFVAKKTAFALSAIENYLKKLQSDESKLKRLRF